MLVQHRVEVDLAKELPMVEIDPGSIRAVLFNLLDNATKYAPAGTTVQNPRAGTIGNTVGVQVLDEGEGIPPDDLEHIFDKFYRARKAGITCERVPDWGLADFSWFRGGYCGAPFRRPTVWIGPGAVFTIGDN